MFVARSLRTNETHELNSIEELIQDLEVLNIKNKTIYQIWQGDKFKVKLII